MARPERFHLAPEFFRDLLLLSDRTRRGKRQSGDPNAADYEPNPAPLVTKCDDVLVVTVPRSGACPEDS
jgi:hypothetical protein